MKPSEAFKLAGEIIVGYDNSDGARRALRVACEIADPHSAITVIHAVDVPPHVASLRSFEKACQELAQEFESSAREVVAHSDKTVRYLTAVGKPAEVLADEARRLQADVIIVGSRGFGAVRSATSSVTQRLLRQAPCPVLMIPPHQARRNQTKAGIRRTAREVRSPALGTA